MIKTVRNITLLAFGLTVLLQELNAQVAVGHDNPQESSILDVDASDKGMLIPRVALTTLNNQAPIDGTIASSLLVYNTNAELGTGFYYWNKNQWHLIQTAGTEKNVYNSDGVLTGDRKINLNGHPFSFVDPTGRGIHLKQPEDLSDTNSPYTFATNNSLVFQVDQDDQTLEIGPSGNIRMGKYGKGIVDGTTAYNLGVTANGDVIETTPNIGLQYYSYHLDNFNSRPDILHIRTNIKPRKSGNYKGILASKNGAISSTKPPQDDYFVIMFTGYYDVKTPGNFIISMQSDDGARVYIDGILAEGTWTGSDASTVRTANVNLSMGKHRFEFWYYEKTGAEAFEFHWESNPDGKSGTINASDFTID